MLFLLLYHFANHAEPTSDEIEWGRPSTTRSKETPGVFYRFLRLIASTCQNIFLWFYGSIWFLDPLNHGFFSQSSIFVRHINIFGACLRNLAFLVCLLNLAFAWFFIHLSFQRSGSFGFLKKKKASDGHSWYSILDGLWALSSIPNSCRGPVWNKDWNSDSVGHGAISSDG